MLESKSSALPTWLRPIVVGAPRRIRTPGTRIRSPLLYPAELVAHIYSSILRQFYGRRRSCPDNHVERVMGIEPTQSAWKADVLPLNYTRTYRLTSDFHIISSAVLFVNDVILQFIRLRGTVGRLFSAGSP